MSKTYRVDAQAADADAIAWVISAGDHFDVKRICLTFDAAPTTSENITVTINSNQGAAFDTVVATVDPTGATSVVITDINGILKTDTVDIAYANTDTNSITGFAVVEL